MALQPPNPPEDEVVIWMWDYKAILLRTDPDTAQAQLQAEGRSGWELVNVAVIEHSAPIAYLKRIVGEVGGLRLTTTTTSGPDDETDPPPNVVSLRGARP